MARLPSMWTWFRTSRAVVMVLTNGTLQINNFRDHTKTILCPLLSAITTLETNKPMKTYKFSYLETHGCTQSLAEKISYAIEKVLSCLLFVMHNPLYFTLYLRELVLIFFYTRLGLYLCFLPHRATM